MCSRGCKMFLLTVIVIAAPHPLSAQSPFLRATDTRTATPESLLAPRPSWGIDASFGATMNRGNVHFTYITAALTAVKKWESSAVSFAGSMLYNTFGTTRVFNQGTGTLRYDRWLSERWRLFGFSSHSYNEF